MYEQVTMHHTFYKAGRMEMIYRRKAEKGGERGGRERWRKNAGALTDQHTFWNLYVKEYLLKHWTNLHRCHWPTAVSQQDSNTW